MRGLGGALVGTAALGACLWLALAPAAGCARRRPAEAASGPGTSAVPLAVNVYADAGRTVALAVRPPAARVWLASVTPARLPVPAPALPEALPDSAPPPEVGPPALAVDPGLKPPVLREPGTLTLPPGRRGAGASVELDVRVDEAGRVSAALDVAAAGDTASGDRALLEAARRCALGMRFYPALQAGRPVAVWCRQRFDFTGAGR
jgi:hypothetical protein